MTYSNDSGQSEQPSIRPTPPDSMAPDVPSFRQEDGVSGFRPQNSSQLFDYKWILMSVAPVLPAKPVPDICYRGAGIQGNGGEPGVGQIGVGRGTPRLPSGRGGKTLDSRLQPAGMTEGRVAGRTKETCGKDGREGLREGQKETGGNPGEWAGSQGAVGLGVGRRVCLRGEEKKLWIPAYNLRE